MTTTPNTADGDLESGDLAGADDVRAAAEGDSPGIEIGLTDDGEGSSFEPEEDDEQ